MEKPVESQEVEIEQTEINVNWRKRHLDWSKSYKKHRLDPSLILPDVQTAERVLYFIPDHGAGYKAFDLFINIYYPNRLYNCSLFDE